MRNIGDHIYPESLTKYSRDDSNCARTYHDRFYSYSTLGEMLKNLLAEYHHLLFDRLPAGEEHQIMALGHLVKHPRLVPLPLCHDKHRGRRREIVNLGEYRPMHCGCI